MRFDDLAETDKATLLRIARELAEREGVPIEDIKITVYSRKDIQEDRVKRLEGR